ncbi:hypothetical protein K1T71_005660 [Dendrolimus kikuchii]|uniref:Uncharacterized protein n=1 Tax=Dendrolimus kikuchii TaxID=765133 RepID=A0ACC1D502_9NEOP|nr:hypothetical protein K1T71_005660 [Dendrolimus kikuchii]
MSNTKRLVLQSFKNLHRTSMKVFQGDQRALTAARLKINEEYSRNKNVIDTEAIKAMIKFGEDVERELRTQVIQAKQVKPGVFEARITEDTVKLDNTPYNYNAVLDDESSSGPRPCCQDEIKNK